MNSFEWMQYKIVLTILFGTKYNHFDIYFQFPESIIIGCLISMFYWFPIAVEFLSKLIFLFIASNIVVSIIQMIPKESIDWYIKRDMGWNTFESLQFHKSSIELLLFESIQHCGASTIDFYDVNSSNTLLKSLINLKSEVLELIVFILMNLNNATGFISLPIAHIMITMVHLLIYGSINLQLYQIDFNHEKSIIIKYNKYDY